jgi:hypothetical protein
LRENVPETVHFPCPKAGNEFLDEFWSELQLNHQQVICQKNSLVPVNTSEDFVQMHIT